MRLKPRGNPVPSPEVVDFYRRAALVAEGSSNEAERAVGKTIMLVLADGSYNATDDVMTVLAQFDAATKRIREELRAIHS